MKKIFEKCFFPNHIHVDCIFGYPDKASIILNSSGGLLGEDMVGKSINHIIFGLFYNLFKLKWLYKTKENNIWKKILQKILITFLLSYHLIPWDPRISGSTRIVVEVLDNLFLVVMLSGKATASHSQEVWNSVWNASSIQYGCNLLILPSLCTVEV